MQNMAINKEQKPFMHALKCVHCSCIEISQKSPLCQPHHSKWKTNQRWNVVLKKKTNHIQLRVCQCLPPKLLLKRAFLQTETVNRFGLAVRRWACKQNSLGSISLQLSFLFKKVVVWGHCLVTLSLTINETLKWLSSLPISMQKSFRWWHSIIIQYRQVYNLPLPPPSLFPNNHYYSFCGC